MKSNEELQNDVQDAIKWEPLLHAAEIGVTALDGVITLTGVVNSYAKKSEAEKAARDVAGVSALVEKIKVEFKDDGASINDNDIAAEILNAFKWNLQVPHDTVKIKVENGWVTLDGQLPWNFQKDAAKSAVKNLPGVKGVSNNIQIKSELFEVVEKVEVEAALRRNWSLRDADIFVKITDHKATLTGRVDSWYQKNEAGRIAFNAPGVWTVDNELEIDYAFELMD